MTATGSPESGRKANDWLVSLSEKERGLVGILVSRARQDGERAAYMEGYHFTRPFHDATGRTIGRELRARAAALSPKAAP